MQGSIKFIGIVSNVLLKVENSAIEPCACPERLALAQSSPFDEILQQALRYPLRILDIALATGQLFDEVRIHQFEFH